MDVRRSSLALLVVLAFVLAGCGGESGVELPGSLADQMSNEGAPALVYVYSDP